MKNYKNIKCLFQLSLYLLAIVFIVSCKNTEVKSEPNEPINQFTISGEIEGLGNNNLHFRIPGKDYNKLGYWADSIVVENNKFSFSDTIIKGYHLVTFSARIKSLQKKTELGYYPVNSAYLNLMLYPGTTINVTGKVSDFMEAYPSGDEVNEDLAKIHKVIFPEMNKSINLLVQSSYEKDSIIIKELVRKSDSISEIVQGIKQNYVESNPTSIVALYYLGDMLMGSEIEDEAAIKIFNEVDEKLNKLSFYKDIEKRIQGIYATREGQVVPEIKTTSTIDGKEFDLTSYRGKYVMIDFWGTWCGPCVGEMPKVKLFLNKHKDQLAVLGVNSGDSKNRMTDFLEQNDYNWQQVMNVRGESEDNFVLKFNVSGFPTKFIIDPEGKIVKKFVGDGEEAFELLEKLLK